jgi:hypothetical protein
VVLMGRGQLQLYKTIVESGRVERREPPGGVIAGRLMDPDHLAETQGSRPVEPTPNFGQKAPHPPVAERADALPRPQAESTLLAVSPGPEVPQPTTAPIQAAVDGHAITRRSSGSAQLGHTAETSLTPRPDSADAERGPRLRPTPPPPPPQLSAKGRIDPSATVDAPARPTFAELSSHRGKVASNNP